MLVRFHHTFCMMEILSRLVDAKQNSLIINTIILHQLIIHLRIFSLFDQKGAKNNRDSTDKSN